MALWQISATDHLIKKKQMSPSSDNCKKPHIHRPRFSWRGLSLPETCSNDNRAGYKQPRRFLEGIGHNFLTQVIEELMKEKALLELEVKGEIVQD